MAKNICILTFCVIAAVSLLPGGFITKAYGLAESAAPDGSNAQAVHTLGETGEGVNVGLISAGNVRTTHEAFEDPCGISHAFSYDFSGDGIALSGHDTRMAGIVASRGDSSHPDDIGVALGADIHSARVANDSEEISNAYLTEALDELVINQGCRVMSTGIQLLDITADGSSTWTKIYDYYAYEYNVVFANASGNYAPEVTIFGDAYNGITTGGLVVTDPDVYLRVGSGSNPGPTLDGRRKPDIVAPAQNQTLPTNSGDTDWYTVSASAGQTSYSGPHTAGTAALLLGLADDTGNGDDNQSEVIKAVIVNSTFPNINDKNNNPTNPAEANNTWHPDRGYGRIDALRAYQLLSADQVTEGVDITQTKGWAYDTMTDYDRHTYPVLGTKNYRLVLTVTWHRQITRNGSIFTAEATPKFNLDLAIKDPNERIIFSETDTLDNLEKVDLLLDGDGMYEITLDNTTDKTRGYGFAFELLAPLTCDFEPIDYIVDIGDLLVMAQQWLAEGAGLEADLTGGGMVNLKDFAEFAEHWLDIDPAYYNE